MYKLYFAKSNKKKTFSSINTKDIKDLNIQESQFAQLTDMMILVDEQDNKIGEISKLEGHLKKNNNQYPHRAFSLFLFDSEGRFLLQRRAKEKITFPLMWTNSVCSHQLPIPQEEQSILGTKIAAQRRLKFEMNIDLNVKDFLLVDKVLYRASIEKSPFEEFEVDHVLISMYDKKAGDIKFNTDEVCEAKYSSIEEIKSQIGNNKMDFTPWFYNILLEKGDEFVRVFKEYFSFYSKEKFRAEEELAKVKERYEKSVKLRKAHYTNL
mmetsp:Transcript_32882/g.34213  ORF Transcript_32882/g.34213 Transcript_32882/m.34213 type:complete len:266 (-) Transcript_32882:8-805(-)